MGPGELTRHRTNAVEADYGFTGLYVHQASESYLALYRAYNSQLGRWLSRDPMSNAEMSQGPHLYEYVRNDPINMTDPLGLKTCWKMMLITSFNDKTGNHGNRLGNGDLATGNIGYNSSDFDSNGNVKPGHYIPTANQAYPNGTRFSIYGNNGSVSSGKVNDSGAGYAEPRPGMGIPNGTSADDWLDKWTPKGNENPEWDWVSRQVDDKCSCPDGWTG